MVDVTRARRWRLSEVMLGGGFVCGAFGGAVRAHAQVCPHPAVIGIVRDAATDAAVPNAIVAVWASPPGGVVQRETTSAPDGTFQWCSLPAAGVIVRARAPISTPAGRISPDAAASRVVDLTHDSVVSIIIQVPVPAAGAPRGRLVGQVRSDSGAPIAGALVRVGTDSARTDTNGAFRLDSLPPGTRTVAVRRIGFAFTSQAVDLRPGGEREIMLFMSRVPTLAAVTVTADRVRAAYDRIGFANRRRLAVGKFLTYEDLQKRHGMEFPWVLGATAGFTFDRFGNAQSARGHGSSVCTEYVVDGVLLNGPQSLDDLQTLLPIGSVGAAELYQAGQAPGLVPQGDDSECIVIVVWTLNALGITP